MNPQAIWICESEKGRKEDDLQRRIKIRNEKVWLSG